MKNKPKQKFKNKSQLGQTSRTRGVVLENKCHIGGLDTRDISAREQ